MGQPHQQKEHRQEQQPPAQHGRHQNGERRDGSHLKAAQDIGFAFLHAAHPRAPQTVAQNAHYEHGADEVGDARAYPGVKHLGESEEENQREQVIEKQHAAVAQREPHIALEQGEVDSHSRKLFPVSSIKASSSDGRLMRMSASSTPFSSSHLTISTTMRAGRGVVTAIFMRGGSTVTCSVSGQLGSASSPSGVASSISMVEWASAFSRISRGVPIATMRPSSTMATRSQSFSASSM